MEGLKTFLRLYYKTFALVWVFLGSALYFINNDHLKKWYYYLILAIVILVGIAIAFLVKRKVRHRIRSLDIDIDIILGDILGIQDETVIIPVNDVFDTELGSIINADSIQGQFTHQIYHGDSARLDTDIETELQPYLKYAVYDNSKIYGKKKRFPLGTVVEVGNSPRYLLVVVTRMQSTNKRADKVATDDLWTILSSVWEYNRNNNSIRRVVMPIIGTGYGRTAPNITAVAKMILLSFYSKSKEEKIAEKITLVLPRRKTERHSIYELQNFVRTLL